MLRKCMRARYSPMIPRANSCAPENNAMIEARNGKPGTGSPCMKYRITTYASTKNPNNVKTNPIMLAICKGIVLKPVIMFIAWVINLRKVYPEVPCFAWPVVHGYGRKAIGAPCQQDIDGHKRPFVVREGFGYLGAKGAEGTDLPGNFCTHDILQGQLGHP